MDNLNRAVDVANIAVEATPQDHPDRAAILSNLGNRLGTRFERTGFMDDLNRALSCFKGGWDCHTSPPSIRIGLASMAAAVALNAEKEVQYALELLELGRCVIAGLLLELRTDISDLREQHPRLATEFEILRNKLDAPSSGIGLVGDATPSWTSQANRRIEADQKFNLVIAKIRDQPTFQNFLLPPTRDELMAAADQGPIVIINVSSYRCDAFLIEHHRIRVLPLPNLTEEKLNQRVQQQSVGSTPVLQWLWKAAAAPILDALGHQQLPSNNWPRVWWIPTGALSHFPVHAAGFHTKGSTKTVLDRVMSSYSSSIKALVYGRRHSVHRTTESGLEQALLVAMQETPCLPRSSALPFATKEVEMLVDLCPSLQLKAVMPLRRREEVLAHLRACKIFHFAGHGRSDPLDPSQSSLLLDDWEKSPLTVGDLRDHRIAESSPFLGYLSACSTSTNRVGRLVDEGIHLASAFQLAGFRHVIGTLWEVSDIHCVDVARVVYETIRDEGMTDVAICRGLHQAVRALRDGHIESTKEARDAELSDGELSDGEVCDEGCETTLESPLYWAPYIHFGV
ncbi:uncharacterized protein BDZ99DRAFT_511648 [Mytilinidion resinicola]|uniref:CHAT domain-containing protein n=1 Tax=Mytilinidion resinicola TaxID=574789 RepID=A0A6A6Y8H7_9PEZI|nr:uncharacterized protein BDZ99DRAFT_511648 [Mytilinidion resinicola]KAF2804435.1 hypothetical protein BDZ99DRAFT_511648 [Mytilinidion resinicola]